jgi:hypothetical protein
MYGKHSLFFVRIVLGLVALGFHSQVIAQEHAYVNDITFEIVNHVRAGDVIHVQTASLVRDGTENMNSVTTPPPEYLRHPENGNWYLRGTINYIWWMYASVNFTVNYLVNDDPVLKQASASVQILDNHPGQFLQLHITYNGASVDSQWYYRDTIANALQMAMQVTWYNNSQGGAELATHTIAPGAEKTVVFGPFPFKQEIVSKYVYYDGELRMVSFSTNNASWWDANNNGTDPSTNAPVSQIPDPGISGKSTNLNNIAWGEGSTNNTAGLAQESTLRQGFENLKSVESQGFNSMVQKLTTAISSLNSIYNEERAQNASNRNFQSYVSAKIGNIESGLYTINSNLMRGSDTNFSSTDLANDMNYSSNFAVANMYALKTFAESVTMPPALDDQAPTDSYFKIKFMGHEMDFDPLHHPLISSLFALSKHTATWFAWLLYYFALLKVVKWVQESINHVSGGGIPNMNILGTNAAGIGFYVAARVFVIYLTGILMAKFWTYSFSSGLVTGSDMVNVLKENPFSVWSQIQGVIYLAKAALPIDVMLALTVAYVNVWVFTIIAVHIYSLTRKSVPV